MKWQALLNDNRLRSIVDPPTEPKKAKTKHDRSEFERDYDRLIFSTPFKRLQDKAQVFPLEEHDAIRTRLTHSLEVSCVARGLAKSICIDLEDKKLVSSSQARDIETIAAACALAHDMGNPPFGHAGERAIAEWFQKKTIKQGGDPNFFGAFSGWKQEKDGEKTQLALDFLCFDGNAHTQRLLSRLQVLSDQYGMNLTAATLAASCKYTACSHETSSTGSACQKKFGFFASEEYRLQKVFQYVGTDSARHPIAHIVEAADDIVNRAADLEDGVRKRKITQTQLDNAFQQYLSNESLKNSLEKVQKELDESKATEWTRAEGWASVFRTWSIGEMVQATQKVFLDNYKSIMSGAFDSDLITASSTFPLYGICKNLAVTHLFKDRTVIKRELMGKKIIHDLMDFFWEAIRKYDGSTVLDHFDGKAIELVSPNYRHVFQSSVSQIPSKPEVSRGDIPIEYYRMLLITDQISGMTDSFAVQLHRELFNA